MTDLNDLVEAYKRELALPGRFSQEFPTVTDTMIADALADAFAHAQLDGFFSRMELDVDSTTVTPDLSTAGAALVILYAGTRATRQQLQNMASGARYKAGPVEYEKKVSASVLQELLKGLEARRKELLVNAQRGAGTSVFVLDGYVSRASAHNFYGGFFAYEMALQSTWGID